MVLTILLEELKKTNKSDKNKCYEVGMNDILVKPFTSRTLIKKIYEVLQKKED